MVQNNSNNTRRRLNNLQNRKRVITRKAKKIMKNTRININARREAVYPLRNNVAAINYKIRRLNARVNEQPDYKTGMNLLNNYMSRNK